VIKHREEASARLRALDKQPVAIEASWDGDTVGWCVMLSGVLQGGPGNSEQGFYEVWLTSFRASGGDFRVFTGQVPPWPEAQDAAVLGRELANQLAVPFFFVSPDFPEIDCPHWWEQDRAYPCSNCGKLLIQGEPCPWRGMCYQCHVGYQAPG
jgi:hypothetical protein